MMSQRDSADYILEMCASKRLQYARPFSCILKAVFLPRKVWFLMHRSLHSLLSDLGIPDLSIPPDAVQWQTHLEKLDAACVQHGQDHLFRMMFEQISDPAFVLDLHGKHVAVNRAAADLLRYDLSEAQQLSYKQVVVPDEHAQSDDVRQALLRGEDIPPFERTFLRKDGAPVFVEVQVRLIRDETGAPAYILSQVRDIGERKLLEDSLLQSEARFRRLIEGLQVGVVVHQPDTTISVVNARALAMLGLTEDQMRGRTTFDPQWNVIHEDGRPFPSEAHPVSVAITTGQPVQQVVMGVFRPRTQDRVWLLVDAMPELDEDGLVAQVAVTFTDISDQVHTKQTLRQTEARYHMLLQGVPETGFLLYDRDLRVLLADGAELERIGYGKQRVEGESISDLMPEAEFEQVEIMLHAVLQGKQIAREIPYGTQVYALVCAPLYDEYGVITHGMCALQNITQRKLQEQQAIELAGKSHALETLQRLLTGIAHDLRTPLSVMNTNLYLIRRKLAEPDACLPRLDLLEGQVSHMAAIVNDALDVGRLESGAEVMSLMPTALDALMQTLIIKEMDKFRDHTLQLALDADLPHVPIDAYWIERALRQLILNAATYSPKGSEIRLHARRYDSGVAVEVIDQGVGIAPDDLKNIFDHFFRADSARPADKGGTGLGLTIVRRIMAAHDGRVDVESNLGRGSTFRLWLPLTEAGR